MQQALKNLRVAMCAWEIGRPHSGLGSKVGGLGVVVEELPPEIIKAAQRRGVELEIVTLSPCFAHYNREKLTKLDIQIPVSLHGHTFNVTAYEHVFTERLHIGNKTKTVKMRMVYFWDHWQFHWTTPATLYPDDPQVGIKMFSTMGQSMAAYIRQNNFNTVHLHDYHVGLVPFYLGDEYLSRVPIHLTVHNATYQGDTPPIGGGPAALNAINLPGDRYWSKYFDHFGKINLMKACMQRVHEADGCITTVSGDLGATWGYASELKESHAHLYGRAWGQKGGRPGDVFLPNRGLDLFEKLPILGITNGLSLNNRADQMPELQAAHLKEVQARRGHRPLFTNPIVQEAMLAEDHTFDATRLEVKQKLRRLLYLEAFHHEPIGYPILFVAVGRLVDQKNLGLIGDVIPRVLGYDNQVKFIVLASAPDGDRGGKLTEEYFARLSKQFPGQVYFNNSFNQALARLIFAGGDFALVPSRFEPCGLTDYEAAWLGTVPIARATGGLPKLRGITYLYEWLDVADRLGEINAFFWKIKEAIDVMRNDYPRHEELIRRAMNFDCSWDTGAELYLDLYRCGLLAKHWREERKAYLQKFAQSLGKDRAAFAAFFGYGPHLDPYDAELRSVL